MGRNKYYRVTLKIQHEAHYDICETHLLGFEEKHKPNESASIEERIMAFAKSDLHDYETIVDRDYAENQTCAGTALHPYGGIRYDSVEISDVSEAPC